MKKYIWILLLIAAMQFSARSQMNHSSFLERTEFKIGYYGTVRVDNGLNTGAEYLWKTKQKVKEKKKGQKVISHQLLFNHSIGYSTNFSNQTDNGLSAHFGLTWRRTTPKKRQLHVEVNPLGYYRSFLPETYEIEGGEVTKVDFPGRSYYAPSIAFGIGKLREGKRRSGWYMNLNISMRTPHNGSSLPYIAFQYGQRFNFKNNHKK